MRRALHPLRLLALALLVALLPRTPTSDSGSTAAPELRLFESFSSDGLNVSTTRQSDGTWSLSNSSGEIVGSITRTRPAANDAIGYRGVTEAALAIDKDGIVRQVVVLSSDDTPEHVQAVKDSSAFLNQFVGWRWPNEIPEQLDGVSGATLTSLALVEGVRRSAGAKANASTVFPKPISVADAKMFKTKGVSEIESWRVEDPWLIANSQSNSVRIVRTGPLIDSLHGYQGPTELMLAIGSDDRILEIAIRQSYDNQPYVGYLKPEPWFWKAFQGKTISELANLNLERARVEGISGATMTSLAVAQTVVTSASAVHDQRQESTRIQKQSTLWPFIKRITLADWSTFALVVVGAIWQRWGGPGRRRWRKLYLSLVILVVGFWSGNLLSLSLLSGWASAGIAWRLAPVLSFLFVASLVLPAINKSNPYCNHICPHGALQQLVMPNRNRRTTLPRWITKGATWVPGTLLSLAYVSMALSWGWHFSNWEPFHAYRITMGSATSIGLAVASVLASIWIPMAYCRYGCATGRLIDYIRRRGAGDRISIADWIVFSLVALVVVMRIHIIRI